MIWLPCMQVMDAGTVQQASFVEPHFSGAYDSRPQQTTGFQVHSAHNVSGASCCCTCLDQAPMTCHWLCDATGGSRLEHGYVVLQRSIIQRGAAGALPSACISSGLYLVLRTMQRLVSVVGTPTCAAGSIMRQRHSLCDWIFHKWTRNQHIADVASTVERDSRAGVRWQAWTVRRSCPEGCGRARHSMSPA